MSYSWMDIWLPWYDERDQILILAELTVQHEEGSTRYCPPFR